MVQQKSQLIHTSYKASLLKCSLQMSHKLGWTISQFPITQGLSRGEEEVGQIFTSVPNGYEGLAGHVVVGYYFHGGLLQLQPLLTCP